MKRLLTSSLVAASLLLGGCGLRPLYANGSKGAVAQVLADVDVAPIEGHNGWLVRNALRDRLQATQGGHGAGHALDVACQWRVGFLVAVAVLAHDVDQRHLGALGVVQVGQAVAQTRGQVQQCAGRLVGHAGVAVRSACDHALEQTEHAAHAGDLVQRRDKLHLRCPGVGEAHVHLARQQCLYQRFCTVAVLH